ncbi:restriction endonuclease [Terracoccus luteus]|uniref:Restriction endonuclease type IV Mrr domain-containing protein n=1 Tax=Terracoccus luteus TaxID=53356 RepID=A0A839Q5H1_9MICO|nr:restriction endonuclease [Terracoccus luteus]MBB2988442.1 hypothetical protein [Terracoccus luteus]MCP2174103.1 hypothetical protein [Terracoccus luteus]
MAAVPSWWRRERDPDPGGPDLTDLRARERAVAEEAGYVARRARWEAEWRNAGDVAAQLSAPDDVPADLDFSAERPADPFDGSILQVPWEWRDFFSRLEGRLYSTSVERGHVALRVVLAGDRSRDFTLGGYMRVPVSPLVDVVRIYGAYVVLVYPPLPAATSARLGFVNVSTQRPSPRPRSQPLPANSPAIFSLGRRVPLARDAPGWVVAALDALQVAPQEARFFAVNTPTQIVEPLLEEVKRLRAVQASRALRRARKALPPPPGRLIRTARDGEEIAAEWVRWFGFRDADTTPVGADEGIDVVGAAVVAQVKMEAVPTGRPAVQQLFGVAAATKRQGLFFSLAGYTPPALAWATAHDIALFRFDLQGVPEPVTPAAAALHAKASTGR